MLLKKEDNQDLWLFIIHKSPLKIAVDDIFIPSTPIKDVYLLQLCFSALRINMTFSR